MTKADASAAPVIAAGSAPPRSSSATIAPPPPPPFTLQGIPNPKAPGLGAITAENYPPSLDSGMSDPAHAFGYLRDRKTFAYCEPDICCRSGSALCRFYDENDHEHTWYSPVFYDGGEKPEGDNEKKSLKEIEELPKKEGLAVLTSQDGAFHQKPPPLPSTAIPYGNEITLVWDSITPPENQPEDKAKPPVLRVGGKLAGEKPVYVAFPPQPDLCKKYALACLYAELNGISVAPSGEELVFVMFMHHPSHGSSITHVRVKSTAFAALVFNDTGMAHHKKKEWAKSAELFTRAVYADPTKELFAFNLACALARQSDARAEQALAHAIKLGGDAVKKRAAKDADFASVRDAAWFKRAVE